MGLTYPFRPASDLTACLSIIYLIEGRFIAAAKAAQKLLYHLFDLFDSLILYLYSKRLIVVIRLKFILNDDRCRMSARRFLQHISFTIMATDLETYLMSKMGNIK